MATNKALKQFIFNLSVVGISISHDEELRRDGTPLGNYVFERDGKKKIILKDIINRNWGQSYYFKQIKNYIIYVPLSDEEYYKHFYIIITETIDNG